MFRIRVRRNGGRGRHSGYMLLFLMLAVAMMTITMLAVARNYRRQIIRDREVEMIHRGTQYERAVRLYFKKFGTYPTSIEQLENTNDIRFLRKRYKDPMSRDGQWQIVHMSDLPADYLTALGGVGGVTVPGAVGATGVVGGLPGTMGSVNTTQLQSSSATNPASAPAGTQTSGSVPAAADGSAGSSTSGSGSASSSAAGSSTGANSFVGSTPGQQESSENSSSGPATTGSSGLGAIVGGPMLGVMSKSKAEGIHAFNDKSHYNQWFFIYAPAQDTGKVLPNGPFNPKKLLAGAATTTGQPTSAPASAPPPTNTPAGAMPPATPAP